MSEVPSRQPPQQLLDLIGRPYKKRDEILESSNRLVDYSYRLESCSESELQSIQAEIRKEINRIISNVNELAPFLDSPHIGIGILIIANALNQDLEESRSRPEMRGSPARIIRNSLCPVANITSLKLTPKSIKKAYGVEIGIKGMMTLKAFFEHQQDNY
jgi:hypothetical protein